MKKEKQSYKEKKQTFTIILFSVLMFCSFFSIFPVQDILPYSEAIEPNHLIKSLFVLMILNIILILISYRKSININEKLSLFLSTILTIIYIFIFLKLKILYFISVYSILRTLIVVLSLKLTIRANSIKKIIKMSLQDQDTMGEYSTYLRPEFKKPKYIIDDFRYWVIIQNKNSDIELISACILIVSISFIRDNDFLWILFILIILNIINLNNNKCILVRNNKK